MDRKIREVAERLRKRSEFEDLLQVYDEDKVHVTLPARLAISALAGFEHAEAVTAQLGVDHARRVAATLATQARPTPPPPPPAPRTPPA